MDLKTRSKFEDRILDLFDDRDNLTRSDLQGAVMAIVLDIERESEIPFNDPIVIHLEGGIVEPYNYPVGVKIIVRDFDIEGACNSGLVEREYCEGSTKGCFETIY